MILAKTKKCMKLTNMDFSLSTPDCIDVDDSTADQPVFDDTFVAG